MNLEQRVYKKLLDVPKGKITTYGELAKAVGIKTVFAKYGATRPATVKADYELEKIEDLLLLTPSN